MIWESWYWKQPLLEMADRLRALKNASELDDEILAQVERDIFIGFYSIRRLIETVVKVTDSTKALNIRLWWFMNLAPVNWRNNHRFNSLYDFKARHQEMRDIVFISGRIIHSFIFAPCVNDQGSLEGIFFTSDKDRNIKLYLMEIDDVISVFERVGNDDPQRIEWYRHPDGSETTKVT